MCIHYTVLTVLAKVVQQQQCDSTTIIIFICNNNNNNNNKQCQKKTKKIIIGREIQYTGRPVHLPARYCGVFWPHELWCPQVPHWSWSEDFWRWQGNHFLFQRISILLFRFNYVLLHNSFELDDRPPGALAFPFFLSFSIFFLTLVFYEG